VNNSLVETSIDNIDPGPEMDDLIELHVYGQKLERGWAPMPYSTEWEWMGRLIDTILEQNWWSDIGGDFFLENWQDNEWVCCNRAPGSRKERYRLIPVFYAVGKTPMLAVCRAALKARLGLNAK
jgi:hypothetical protein